MTNRQLMCVCVCPRTLDRVYTCMCAYLHISFDVFLHVGCSLLSCHT